MLPLQILSTVFFYAPLSFILGALHDAMILVFLTGTTHVVVQTISYVLWVLVAVLFVSSWRPSYIHASQLRHSRSHHLNDDEQSFQKDNRPVTPLNPVSIVDDNSSMQSNPIHEDRISITRSSDGHGSYSCHAMASETDDSDTDDSDDAWYSRTTPQR